MDLTKLGKYDEAVRKFTERVPKLPESEQRKLTLQAALRSTKEFRDQLLPQIRQ